VSSWLLVALACPIISSSYSSLYSIFSVCTNSFLVDPSGVDQFCTASLLGSLTLMGPIHTLGGLIKTTNAVNLEVTQIDNCGRVIADLDGPELTASDHDFLRHPALAGVILFTRNTLDASQTRRLCLDIKRIRPDLLIAIDQEGGRVQRLRKGVTALPAMAELGKLYEVNPGAASTLASDIGWLLGTEIRQCAIDFTFAPVLDLDDNRSPAIGNRSFSARAEVTTSLAQAFCRGLKQAGVPAIGKHFPGHGKAVVDSHEALPKDERRLGEILTQDAMPFSSLGQGALDAVMPAHILFPAVDPKPVGFSSFWLNDVLRQQLQFNGLIFSDDLSMGGASWAGDVSQRAIAASEAGCDILLVCNDRSAAVAALEVMLEKPLDARQKQLLQPFYGPQSAKGFDVSRADEDRISTIRAQISDLLQK
jgi:beta-N-acetylhexosaminidase